MGTKKRKHLSCLMLIVLCAMTCFSSLNVMAETKKVEVTGVGIFDQDPNKGIHTFDSGSKVIEVTFNSDFWSADKAATNDGKNGNWLEWEASINNYLLINGKKPQEWINASWGSVVLYAKSSASLGQYLEINLSSYEGLPSESTDSTITFLKGFAGVIEEDITYKYIANNNVPFVTETGTGDEGETEIKGSVTGVGIFDQDPNKGIHTFDNGSKMIEVTFNKNFWSADKAVTNDGKNGNWLEWEAAVNDYLLINGKKPQEWINASWGSVMLYAKNSASLGQYLEINLSAYEGLPSESTDSTITFLKGFAGIIEEDVTYKYTANNNVPYVINGNDGDNDKPGSGGESGGESGGGSEEVNTTFDVIGVGIFDTDPNKGIHTFENGNKIIQIQFNRNVVDPAEMDASGSKMFVEWDLGKYILINGKTPAEWVGTSADPSWGCVQMHIRTNATHGQYLEINLYDYAGLPAENADGTIQILSGLTTYDGKSLGKTLTYEYKANNNKPWTLAKSVERGEFKFTDDLVAGIGIFDQEPYKGIHDFGETRMIQIKFNQKFYDPSGLDASGTKLWVQSEFGDYIKINGKTVTEWNNISFNSVQMHVKTNDALGGQYIEIILSNLEGLPTVDKDSTIEILSKFPVWGGTKLKVANTFVYYANENNPYIVKTEPQTGDNSTAIPFFVCVVSLCFAAIAYLQLKKGGATK